VVLGVALFLSWGCVGGLPSAIHYRYFASPSSEDAWAHKIRLWQARELADHEVASLAETAPVAASPDDSESEAAPRQAGSLREKYEAFRTDRKRAMARDLAEWIQDQAQEHYVPDGPIDHWATLEETFLTDGDDCDGLELVVYHLLRELGFESDEVFRGIVFRRNDNQHHMVTLWFEDPNDPWVIDPTGAMTSGMPRMSEVPGWAPLKVFSEDSNFTVQSEQLAQN
jgi:hypothetical protein